MSAECHTGRKICVFWKQLINDFFRDGVRIFEEKMFILELYWCLRIFWNVSGSLNTFRVNVGLRRVYGVFWLLKRDFVDGGGCCC